MNIMKKGMLALLLYSASVGCAFDAVASAEEAGGKYQMKTASFSDGQIHFESPEDFEEVLKVGFFRVKRPESVDIEVTRKFARGFNSDPKYTSFGSTDPVNGYIISKLAQTIRFTLERDHWDKDGWSGVVSEDDPNYAADIQVVGNQMKDVGIAVLNSILDRYEIPEELRFQATAGSAYGEGSYYLNFNYYDPANNPDKPGLGAHTDWGMLTVLDVVEEGLEAEIDGMWRPLALEDGYFVINFGEPLQKLLPGVNACMHRVITQTKKPRTSTIMFIDPRVGPFRPSAGQHEGAVGMVWDWDPIAQALINGEPTTDYFGRLSQSLYGELNQESK